MNEPITRRRRRRRLDSSTNVDELISSSHPIESSEITSDEPIAPRPRRRRRDSSTGTDELVSLPDPVESNSDDHPSSKPQMIQSPSPANGNNTNLIRADLLEDLYHSELAESDFSDDTHDWGWDNPNISDDYWHFLGQYE